MCRLLGLVANKPVDLEFSLVKFKEFASWNPDGWRIGWYENKKAKIFKQGISAISDESQLPKLSKMASPNPVSKGTSRRMARQILADSATSARPVAGPSLRPN
jgi:hypothetical protein